MAKYLSQRQKVLNVGIVSYTENETTLSVIGKVGIGTKSATTDLDIHGSFNLTGVSTFQNNVSVAGTITELYNGTYWNVVTQADVGYGASQVPLNQYLGQLAFLDDYHPNGLRRTGGGSDDVVVNSNGYVGINSLSPTTMLDVDGDVSISGVITATTFNGYINSGIGTITTLNGTTVTYTTGNFNSSYINVGVVTTLSGTNINYSGIGTIDTLDTTTGTIDYLNNTNLNVSGVSTFASNVDINASIDVDGHTELDDLNVSGISTFASNVDINAGLDVEGRTELDTTNISETLNVVGVSTFESNVDINASIDVDGHTELDDLNVTGVSTFIGIGTFQSDLYVGGDLYVADDLIFDEFTVRNATLTGNLQVSGISTFNDNVDINAGLDVDGRTELDTTNISETLSVSGVSTFGSNVDINASVDIQNNLNVTGVSTFGGNVYLGDNDNLYFGDGNDLQIYHNGSDSLIRDTGTGDLYIDGGNVFIRSNLSENAISANSNGSVELYYDNNKKFETSGVGVTVYGNLYLQGGFSIGFNNDSSILTFNDGNNQTRVGYWTNKDGFIINGDGNSKSSVVLQTGNLEIDQNAYISGILGVGNTVYAATDVGIGTISPSEKLDVNGTIKTSQLNVTGVSTFGGSVYLGDNDKAIFGAGGDLEIYHDGNNSFIKDDAVGALIINTNTLRVKNTNNDENIAVFTQNGSVELYYDNNKKLETTSDGVNITGTTDTDQLNVTGVSTFGGNVYLGDNDVLHFGDNNDLQIVHNVSYSLVGDFGVGNLILAGNTSIDLMNPGGTEYYARFNNNGAVELYYDNNKKLETTFDGVNITGTTDTDQLNVSGIATIATIDATNATIDNLTFTSGTAITSVDTDLSSVSATDNTLASAKAIKTYVDAQITAQDLDFGGDTGTGAVDLDSQTLTISGTANEIETSASGQTLQIGLPNDVVISNDLQVNNNAVIQGNLTVYGTETIVNTQSLNIFDKDIILGIGTNNGETDDTANGGGVAIASTEGSPIVCLQCGVNTLPGTYKQFLWLKNGTFAGLATDTWISNYAISIGSTIIDYGTRLAVGDVQITDDDIKVVRNIDASGIITASRFVSDVTTGTAPFTVSSTTVVNNLNADTVDGIEASSFLRSDAADTGTGLITLTNGLNVSGVSTFTAANKGAISVRSGASGSYTSIDIGRTSTEGVFAVASSAGIYANNAVAGDIIFRANGASNKILFNRGATNASLAIDGSNVLVGTVSSTGTTSQPLQVSGGAYVSGDVGIGITNPSSKLHINGDININNNAIISNNAGANNIDHIWHNDDNGASYGQGGTWHFVSDSIYNADGNSAIRAGAFANMSDTGTANQKLQISGGAYVSGNLGVGVTNPGAKLVLPITGSLASDTLQLGTSNSWASGAEEIYTIGFGDPISTQMGIGMYGSTRSIWNRYGLATHVKSDSEFSIKSSSWTNLFGVQGGTGNVYIKGDVGIGTDAATEKLDVIGTVKATLFSGSGASLTNIPNGALDNSSVNFGGVTVSLGSTDATPAFDLQDATGLPISTGVSGLGANVATFLATPSSSNLAAAVTDETGSGALVFATSPTLVTPTLGAASATSINATGIITASRFVSDVTTGTAPFTVSSTTVVNNLNADTVDGLEASQFLRSDANDTLNGNLTINASGGPGLVVEAVANQLGAIFSRDLDSPDESAVVLIASDADGTDDLAFEIRGNTTGSSVDKSNTLTSPDTTFAVFANGVTAIGYNNLGLNYSNPNSALVGVNGSADFNGTVYATTFNGNLTGTATTATALENARDFSISGDVATSSPVSFNGTGNVNLAVALSNNFSANTSGIITASRFVSDVTTGTAPFTVSSTTLVSNLNADLLDGQEGSYYRNASNINAGTIGDAYLPATITSDITGNAATATTSTNVVGAANRILYNNATNTTTTSSNLVFDGTNLGIGTDNPGSTLSVGGTITELYNGTFWNIVSQADIGSDPDQIPLNQYLGQLAFLDDFSPNGLRREGGSSDDVVVGAGGSVGIGITNPTKQLHIEGDTLVNGNLYLNDTNYLSSLPTGDFGSVQINGSGKGGWEGYSIDGHSLFMSEDSTGSFGLYDDTYNHWALRHVRNGGDSSTQIRGGNNSTNLTVYGTDVRVENVPLIVNRTTLTGTASQNLQVDGGAYVSGNLGVGATNPTTALEIYANDPILTIRDTSTSITNANATLRLAESNASGALDNYWDIVADTTVGNWGFAVKEGTTTRLAIQPSTGNIGINSTAPTEKLDVVGTVKATDFNTTSDQNLKTNIHTIENPLDKIVQIRGVNFEWKENNKPSAGVIAQEVEKVLPELVNGEDTKTVNYNGLIGLLIEAVKEQNNLIEAQQEEINELKKKVG